MTRGPTRRRLGLATVFALLLLPVSAQAQFVQQGPKLLVTDATGAQPQQGFSVSVSADGNTAVVGAPSDNGFVGASWVFTRSGAAWTQQGLKLVGSGAAATNVQQGYSIAISADGNTFIVGGLGDAGNIGAAWMFTRSGGVWSQQGEAGRHVATWGTLDKAIPLRSRPTATPPSSEETTTTRARAQRGSGSGPEASGLSRETSWLALKESPSQARYLGRPLRRR